MQASVVVTTTTTATTTAKRKALDMDTSMNPLMAAAAAKRAKKEKSATANKRKLINTEDAPGGLLIVRPTAATTAELDHPSFSQPLPSTSNPPSKKFRAAPSFPSSSQPLPSRSHSHQTSTTNGLSRKPSSSSRLLDDDAAEGSDADLERDVRAMEDEADRLRRNSRAYTTIDGSLLASATHPANSSSSSNANAMFNFPPPPGKPPSQSKTAGAGSSKGTGRGRSRSRLAGANSSNNDNMEVDSTDSQIPIASNETPQQQRNKILREGAMAAIKSSSQQDDGDDSGRGRGRDASSSSGRSGSGGGKHRRASSLSRGKRISTAFENTGVITQPHNTVSESSFYKHIDADLPDVERVRQLLIWCSLRAAGTVNKGAASPDGYTPPPNRASTPSSSTSSQQPAAPTATKLPPLPPKALEVLKKAQEEFVRSLAEKRVDINIHAATDEGRKSRASTEEVRENEQNVRNRGWEVTYSGHIQRAQAEDESWKRVSYEYDGYCKKLSTSLEKRKKALEELKSSSSQPLPSSSKQSSKSKGKGRASTGGGDDVDMDDEEDGAAGGKEGEGDDDKDAKHLALFPQPHELPPAFQRGAQLARSILSRRPRPRLKPPSPSTPSPTKNTNNGHRRRSSMRSRPSLPLDPSTSSTPSSAVPATPTDQDPLPDISEPSPNLESLLLGKLPTLPYLLDTLHVHLNAARSTTSASERLLDERYRVLNRVLEGRMRSSSVPPSTSSVPGGNDGEGSGSGRGRGRSVLTTYLPSSSSSTNTRLARSLYPSQIPSGAGGNSRSQSVPPPPPPFPSTSHLPSPHTLLRALTRVDAARPPAQIGDAARRAAREVQRAEESGMGPIAGERRVTLLPGMTSGPGVPATPRKGGGLAPPSTPGRRTPARDRTPGRERTPGR